MVLNTKSMLVRIAAPQVFLDSFSQTCWGQALGAMASFAAAPRGGRSPFCIDCPKATWLNGQAFCSTAGLIWRVLSVLLAQLFLLLKKWVKGTFLLQPGFSFPDTGYLYVLPQSKYTEWGVEGRYVSWCSPDGHFAILCINKYTNATFLYVAWGKKYLTPDVSLTSTGFSV